MQWLHDMLPFKSHVSCNVRILFASNCARNRAPVLWHTYCLKLQQSQKTNQVHSYHFVTTFRHHLSFSRSVCSRASRSAWWPANVLQLSMEKETTKATEASTAWFQGRATPGTAVHDYTLSDWKDLHFSCWLALHARCECALRITLLHVVRLTWCVSWLLI